MRVSNVTIQNGFKRFHELSVGPIPETARLVVLLGANGSGKTSFLDALLYWHIERWNRHRRRNVESYYYERPDQITRPNVVVEMHGENPTDDITRKRAFHFRSAYRYTPDFTSGSIQRLTPIEDSNPVDGLSDEDKSVTQHYNRLVGKAVASFTDLKHEVTNFQVYANDVGPLRESFERLFPDLRLTGLGDPTNQGTFLFTKGGVEDFRYVNLSSGEKAAFDLLLDLHVRKHEYPGSVICLDEPEAHVGLRVQRQLLDEMLNVLSDESQLWIATHSIGMMRRAFELAESRPGEVVFLDFDGHDFDQPVTLSPTPPSRSLWLKAHQIALEDLASLLAPEIIYLCEGDPEAGSIAKKSFDAGVLLRIFGDAYPGVDFISVGGATDQPRVRSSVAALLPGVEIRRVIDRDARTEEAVAQLMTADPALRVLSQRDLENYLLSEEVLRMGCRTYASDPEAASEELIALKSSLLRKAKYPDDVKSIAGPLFEAAKRLWHTLAQPGQDKHEFLRDVCAPLVGPATETYSLLKGDLGLPDAPAIEDAE
jgi:hypothetical protein